MGRSLGEGENYLFQYSDLENSIDCIVHGVTKSRLSDFHFTSPTPKFLGFPCGSAGKDLPVMGDLGSIPGLGRSPGEGKGYPLQYSGLENSMNCIVHGVPKSQTRLSDFHFQGT